MANAENRNNPGSFGHRKNGLLHTPYFARDGPNNSKLRKLV